MRSLSSSSRFNCLLNGIITALLFAAHFCASRAKTPFTNFPGVLLILCSVTLSVAIVVQGQERNTVVAVVNGSTITRGEVDDSIPNKVFALEQQLFALRK